SIQARHATGDEIAGNNSGFLAIQFYDAAGNQLFDNGITTLTAASPTDVWTEFEATGTAPANTSEVRIVMGYQQQDDAAGAIWYDAAMLALDEGGCNPADLAEPFDLLDLSDIDAFIAAFLGGDPAADIAAPFGVIDLSDIDLFIAEFFAGCP
ncbi:MAG: GC-type dockerin domain-anchored protein, partial [Planctomycetota bacterium]